VWWLATVDPMYDLYGYPWEGGDIYVTMHSLPAGTYDFHLCGHGPADDGNSIFELFTGTTSCGVRGTTIWGEGWNSVNWEEGQR
jgi:hypothetical protein